MLPKKQKEQLKRTKTVYDYRNIKKLADHIANTLAKKFLAHLRKSVRDDQKGFPSAEAAIRERLASKKYKETVSFRESLLRALYVDGGQIKIKDGRHPCGLTYKDLWFVLEHGRRDKGIPARPFMRRALEEFKSYADKYYEKQLRRHFSFSTRLKS